MHTFIINLINCRDLLQSQQSANVIVVRITPDQTAVCCARHQLMPLIKDKLVDYEGNAYLKPPCTQTNYNNLVSLATGVKIVSFKIMYFT